MSIFYKTFKLETVTFLFVSIILFIVHIKVPKTMLLAERFIQNTAWIEIILIGLYAGFIVHKMKNPKESPKWRIRIWTLFSVVFFGQLLLGLLGIEECLMKGIDDLHLPIPALIISGPIYRGDLTFMIIFFASTLILSGPSWCSQLCYFGALDGIASKGKTNKYQIKHKWKYKIFGIITIILISIILRISKVPYSYAIIIAVLFGVIGIAIIFIISRKKNKMIHCITYCPIGTIVSIGKFASPFRMSIKSDCTQCMKCSTTCKYDALTSYDIQRLKPGYTCTYCGDCIQSCHSSSIEYHFLKLSPTKSRFLYIFISVSIHAISLAFARI